MHKNTSKTKVLLYSGGLDSWLIDKLWKPDIRLFFDVGTKSASEERKRLPKDVKVIELQALAEHEIPEMNYLLPLRNLIMVAIAANYGDVICLGSEAGSRHFDNGNEFAREITKVINSCLAEMGPDRRVEVVTPYTNWSKTKLLSEYVLQGGSLKEAWEGSFSCYSPKNGKECGVCRSCLQKKEAFRNVKELI